MMVEEKSGRNRGRPFSSRYILSRLGPLHIPERWQDMLNFDLMDLPCWCVGLPVSVFFCPCVSFLDLILPLPGPAVSACENLHRESRRCRKRLAGESREPPGAEVPRSHGVTSRARCHRAAGLPLVGRRATGRATGKSHNGPSTQQSACMMRLMDGLPAASRMATEGLVVLQSPAPACRRMRDNAASLASRCNQPHMQVSGQSQPPFRQSRGFSRRGLVARRGDGEDELTRG